MESGFFILKTLDPTLKNYEYRLAYSENLPDIYGKYNDSVLNWEGNSEEIWKTFKTCFLTSDESIAYQQAEKMSANLGKETECGIMIIQTFRDKTWEELINKI
jgi:hypothetical protein